MNALFYSYLAGTTVLRDIIMPARQVISYFDEDLDWELKKSISVCHFSIDIELFYWVAFFAGIALLFWNGFVWVTAPIFFVRCSTEACRIVWFIISGLYFLCACVFALFMGLFTWNTIWRCMMFPVVILTLLCSPFLFPIAVIIWCAVVVGVPLACIFIALNRFVTAERAT